MFACKFELENTEVEYFKWLSRKGSTDQVNKIYCPFKPQSHKYCK